MIYLLHVYKKNPRGIPFPLDQVRVFYMTYAYLTKPIRLIMLTIPPFSGTPQDSGISLQVVLELGLYIPDFISPNVKAEYCRTLKYTTSLNKISGLHLFEASILRRRGLKKV